MQRQLTLLMALLSFSVLALPTGMGGQALGQSGTVVSRFGRAQVAGRDVLVHVTVVVPPGADANRVASDAIRNQGARPLQSDAFSTTGLVWDQFSDADQENDVVRQYYNPTDDPTGGSGQTALANSQNTWSAVSTSKFALQLAGTTDRCPSLVRECKGPQTFDGFNDVAWLSIGGCCTLAVTWSSTDTDEADMGINTRFSWATNNVDDFDLETVILHENGHVGGLGHSEDPDAVMLATYSGPHRWLGLDDIQGMTWLYPDVTETISGTVTQEGGDPEAPIAGATVAVQGTSFQAVTGLDGGYEISIAPGLYDLTASAPGFISRTQKDVATPATVDFSLAVDPDLPDPGILEITNVASKKNGNGGSFKITWTTNRPADSEVTFTCCGTFTNSELVTDHSMTFRGQRGVEYEYSVTSTDADGNQATSEGHIHQN